MNTVRIFIRKKSYTSLMGRWGMINENNRFADTNIDWANHDHCGGEICNEFFVKHCISLRLRCDTGRAGPFRPFRP